jgi:hypothetical protein
MPSFTVGALSLACLALMGACQSPKAESRLTEPEVRDSAGIEIVTNPAELPANVEHWSLENPPAVTIGAEGKGPEYEMNDVGRVFRYRTGEFVFLMHGGDPHFRVYDSTGKYLRRFGRRGQGPGDLDVIHETFLDAGDTIWATDPNLRRATLFSSDGKFVRTVDLSAIKDEIVWRFNDGTWIIAVRPERRRSEPEVGLVSDTVDLMRTDRDGNNPKPFVRVFSSERRDGQQIVFGRSSAGAASDSMFYIASTDEYQFKAYTFDGKLRRIIRRQAPRVPVTPGMKQAYQNSIMNGMKDLSAEQRSAFEKRFAKTEFATTLPVFGTIQADPAGYLWVAEYRWNSADTTPYQWTIFGPDGRIKATIMLPAGNEGWIKYLTSDYLLSNRTDDMDLVTIVAQRIKKR